MIRLTLYSRPGCHLCDEMKIAIRRVAQHEPITIDEIDISGNDGLEALYGLEVPVLLIDGRKVAKYRISDEELRRAIRGRSAIPPVAPSPDDGAPA